MTPLLLIALAVAGGVGAMLRFLVDGLVRSRFGGRLPWGTIAINVTGSFLLGSLTGLARSGPLPIDWETVLGTGLLGGYTTFSTASVETIRLLQERRVLAAVVNGIGVLVISVTVAVGGYELGLAL